VLLTVSAHGHLRVLGVNSCAGVHCTWIPDGDCPGNLSLGQHTGDGKLGDGKLDRETFLGGTWMFFSGGVGGGEAEFQVDVLLSRDVDAWHTNGCTPRVGVSKYR
jgi:hypothetical protein